MSDKAIEELSRRLKDVGDRSEYLEDEITTNEAIALIASLREALEFYADPKNYKGEFVPGGHTEHGTYVLEHHVNLVRKDGGDRAREALREQS